MKEFDFDTVLKRLNTKLKDRLKTNEWIVYENLYLKNKTEQEVAKILGYKTSEKNRSPGYKQIKNIKKSFKNNLLLEPITVRLLKLFGRLISNCPNIFIINRKIIRVINIKK